MPQIKSDRARLFLDASMLGIVVTVAVLVVVMLASLLQLEEKADAERRDLLKISAQIAECTTAPELRVPPEPKPTQADCYVQARARSVQLAEAINRVTIAAAACGARHPGDVPATRQCTERALKRR